jgi:hypothetical protein
LTIPVVKREVETWGYRLNWIQPRFAIELKQHPLEKFIAITSYNFSRHSNVQSRALQYPNSQLSISILDQCGRRCNWLDSQLGPDLRIDRV